MDEKRLRLEAMKAAIQLVCCLIEGSGGGGDFNEIAQQLGIQEAANLWDVIERIQNKIMNTLTEKQKKVAEIKSKAIAFEEKPNTEVLIGRESIQISHNEDSNLYSTGKLPYRTFKSVDELHKAIMRQENK